VRAKPPLLRLSDLAPGQSGDFFVQLAEKHKGATRDGKPFFTCRFRDARRTATCMVWLDGGWYEACEKDWQEGRFYKIRGGYVEQERYGPQIELTNIRAASEADRADGFDPVELVERSRYDKNFYPFCGGLVEHLLSVTQICLELVEWYAARYTELKPPLNKDLVVAGAVLHDIGRVLEFDGEAGAAQPTVPGRLVGHLFLGRDLVRDTARELGNVNPELLQLLEHVIVSHLNLPEWGSPRLPLVPESLIIHHADDLDAKLEMYARCLRKDVEAGPFTARDPVLGRQLYKGRTV
jgi:3'-5' exoribonuclease